MTDRRFKKVSFHMGMHKTGSSSLQYMLYDARKGLRSKKLEYLGMRRYRKSLSKIVGERSLLDETARQEFSIGLDEQILRNTKRLIISEENLLGLMRHNLTSPEFYPKMEESLRFLKSVLNYERAEVFLGLRSYDSYFNAVYAFRSTQELMLDFDVYRPIILAQTARAPSVIQRIRKIFPRAQISIFFQETMRGFENDIATAMASGFVKHFEYKQDRNIGLSAPAVVEYQEIYRTENRAPTMEEQELIRLKFPLSQFEKPSYWDGQTAERLRAEFLEDVKKILQMKKIRSLSPIPRFD